MPQNTGVTKLKAEQTSVQCHTVDNYVWNYTFCSAMGSTYTSSYCGDNRPLNADRSVRGISISHAIVAYPSHQELIHNADRFSMVC